MEDQIVRKKIMACSNCRKLHKKCDNARPCKYCISTNKAHTCEDLFLFGIHTRLNAFERKPRQQEQSSTSPNPKPWTMNQNTQVPPVLPHLDPQGCQGFPFLAPMQSWPPILSPDPPPFINPAPHDPSFQPSAFPPQMALPPPQGFLAVTTQPQPPTFDMQPVFAQQSQPPLPPISLIPFIRGPNMVPTTAATEEMWQLYDSNSQQRISAMQQPYGQQIPEPQPQHIPPAVVYLKEEPPTYQHSFNSPFTTTTTVRPKPVYPIDQRHPTAISQDPLERGDFENKEERQWKRARRMSEASLLLNAASSRPISTEEPKAKISDDSVLVEKVSKLKTQNEVWDYVRGLGSRSSSILVYDVKQQCPTYVSQEFMRQTGLGVEAICVKPQTIKAFTNAASALNVEPITGKQPKSSTLFFDTTIKLAVNHHQPTPTEPSTAGSRDSNAASASSNMQDSAAVSVLVTLKVAVAVFSGDNFEPLFWVFACL